MTIPIAPASLRRLRHLTDATDQAAAIAIWREAGAASGSALSMAWAERLKHRTGLDDPRFLDARWFAPLLTEFLGELGWGEVMVVALEEEALLIRAAGWPEAESGSARAPACHFSVGVLESFLGALTTAPLAALEVECASAGAPECRFLVSSAAMLAAVRDLLDAGGDWRAALEITPQA